MEEELSGGRQRLAVGSGMAPASLEISAPALNDSSSERWEETRLVNWRSGPRPPAHMASRTLQGLAEGSDSPETVFLSPFCQGGQPSGTGWWGLKLGSVRGGTQALTVSGVCDSDT